ncbi:hypothetical protein [Flavilitoribacter nigricans]|uniref:Uncharacterized protein n=1 Tax=Flavilitoribacter nigricans (strain ATCC 23147 / DSM 23189 / NBRC 102662 / NCIMB 1420 / SS-2) TaxID=1122177 RepID=A0A2D0N8H8_FLAN2|nr:hypothetical protein [Flavilitoribacter nigricans]PHN04696.1 hypothetical protein CRP01_19460 [Flavilitoribacter nigricans DSM 23189 = NBRC 102662]
MALRILIDDKCFQSIFHQETHLDRFGHPGVPNPVHQRRISTFLDILREPAAGIKNEVQIGAITETNLQWASSLVLLTRAEPFSDEAFNPITQFVLEAGNSLLIFSNHNPHEKHDHSLTQRFGVDLCGGYWSGRRELTTTISGACLRAHPLLDAPEFGKPVSSLVTNTTCRIVSTVGTPFLYLPDGMVGRWSSEGEALIPDRIFGLIIDGSKSQSDAVKGKIVILADSGFIADKDSTVPGKGLIDQGDNEVFIRRLIRFICP